MLRLLQWLFVGHVHKWSTLETRKLSTTDGSETGVRYIQQCDHCGIVKKRDLI